MAEPEPGGKLPPSAERMIREVGEKQKRIRRGRRREDDSAAMIAMVGAVGWTVAVPTVLGILAGVWLDRHWPTRISWTLTLLIVGLAIGCVSAWLRIVREEK